MQINLTSDYIDAHYPYFYIWYHTRDSLYEGWEVRYIYNRTLFVEAQTHHDVRIFFLKIKVAMDDFVKLANEYEQYPISVNPTIIDIETNLDRKQFKSKHFSRAENICCVSTTITFILLVVVWIYFDTKETDI